MNDKSSLFDRFDHARETEADHRAEADVRAGRLVPHSAVVRWLSSWSSGKPASRPKPSE